MEMLLLYFVKSAALLAVFFLVYHFLLRKETFFQANRWFLLGGLFTSVILPLITFRKIVWIEPIKRAVHWNSVSQPLSTSTEAVDTFEINWLFVILGFYIVGTALFLFRFAFDFYALAKILKGKTISRQEDYKFLDITDNVSPFSYFNYIVFNSSKYNDIEISNILEHEKIHSDQNHTMDVLISRMFCVVFWFNPFVWLYKTSILQNLEFIADYEASKKITDIKAYQHTMLKITTHDCCVAITNHFYQSLIKKRIVMLNKNQSKKWNSWKYAFVIPVLVGFMFYFQVKVVAQEKPVARFTEAVQDGVQIVCNKNTSDAELEQASEMAKKEHDVTLKFSRVKRNKAGEIVSIKAEFKDKNGKSGVTQINSSEPIQPIVFFKNGNEIGFGNEKSSYVSNRQNGVTASDSVYLGNHNITIAEPPTPPLPPDFGNFPTPPTPPTPPATPATLKNVPNPPKFPEAPKPPVTPRTEKTEKQWLAFDKKMEDFEKKMEAMEPEIAAFDKQMEAFNKKMEAFELDMEPFNKEMEKFDKKMEAFEKEMEAYMSKYEKLFDSEN